MWIYLLIILIVFISGKLYFWFYPPIKYHGPNSKDIVGEVFKLDDESFWKFTPEVIICPLNTTTCVADVMGIKFSTII